MCMILAYDVLVAMAGSITRADRCALGGEVIKRSRLAIWHWNEHDRDFNPNNTHNCRQINIGDREGYADVFVRVASDENLLMGMGAAYSFLSEVAIDGLAIADREDVEPVFNKIRGIKSDWNKSEQEKLSQITKQARCLAFAIYDMANGLEIPESWPHDLGRNRYLARWEALYAARTVAREDEWAEFRAKARDRLSKMRVRGGSGHGDLAQVGVDDIFVPAHVEVAGERKTVKTAEDFRQDASEKPILLITGAGGSGKTTLMRRLALELMRAREQCTPFFLSLAPGDEPLVTGDRFGEIVQGLLPDLLGEGSDEILRRIAKAPGAAIMLDALDESENEDETLRAILALRRCEVLENVPIVVSSREGRFSRLLSERRDCLTWQVSPLGSGSERGRIIAKHLVAFGRADAGSSEHVAERLLENPMISKLCQTPLDCSHVALKYGERCEAKDVLESIVADFSAKAAHTLPRRGTVRRIQPSDMRLLFETLATWAVFPSTRPFGVDYPLSSDALASVLEEMRVSEKDGIRAVSDLSTGSGILSSTEAEHGRTYEFRNEAILSYLAGRGLAESIREQGVAFFDGFGEDEGFRQPCEAWLDAVVVALSLLERPWGLLLVDCLLATPGDALPRKKIFSDVRNAVFGSSPLTAFEVGGVHPYRVLVEELVGSVSD